MKRLLAISLLAAWVGTGCDKVYYDTWETLGKQKRDLLKDNVEELKDDQEQVSDEFKDALTRLKEMYGKDGSKLEAAYDDLRRDYNKAHNRALALDDRVERVEKIAGDLFDEWDGEIAKLHNERYKADSRRKLAATKAKFEALKTSMHRSQKTMKPVLETFEDQVIYLKHNLNAQALGTLKGEVDSIESDIGKLVADMEKSIKQSDAFIRTLDNETAKSGDVAH